MKIHQSPVPKGPPKPDKNRPVALAGNAIGLQTLEVDQLHQEGLTGQGVGLVIMDSGAAHPDLQNRVVTFKDFFNGKDEKNYDDFFHGTAIATAAAGCRGPVPGVAPKSKLVVLKEADENGGVEAFEVKKALAWAKENRERYNIQVINMSFGLMDGQAKVAAAVKELSDLGVLVCTSVGNDGPTPRKLNEFKASPDLLTVANCDVHGTASAADDTLVPQSSRPPTRRGPQRRRHQRSRSRHHRGPAGRRLLPIFRGRQLPGHRPHQRSTDPLERSNSKPYHGPSKRSLGTHRGPPCPTCPATPKASVCCAPKPAWTT